MSNRPTVRIQFVNFKFELGLTWTSQFGFLLDHYDLRVTDDPQFVLVNIRNGQDRCPPRVPGRTYISLTIERYPPDLEDFDYCFAFSPEEFYNNPRYFRLPNYVPRFWRNGYSGEDLVKPPDFVEQRLQEDRKFCCFVASNKYARERVNFCKLLSAYKQVDCAGSVLNNVGYIRRDGSLGPYEKRVVQFDSLYPRAKVEFMKGYKFALCFENNRIPGYTTEKMPEAMLAGCVPIYWGDPLFHRDFNPESSVNFWSCGSTMKALMDRVMEVDSNPELYRQYLEAPYFHDNKPNEVFCRDHVMQGWHRIFAERKD